MNSNNNKIIVFDDDQDILLLCNYILKEIGWEVYTFSNCKDIIDKVSAINPAIILMDNWIPDKGGIAATQEIKKSELLKHIPVIYFSANSLIEKLAREAGADGYLAKPFELEDLENLISSYVKLS